MCDETMRAEYSQGVCEDGAAILKDGQPMTPEQIVAELNKAARAQSAEPVAVHGNLTPAADRDEVDADDMGRALAHELPVREQAPESVRTAIERAIDLFSREGDAFYDLGAMTVLQDFLAAAPQPSAQGWFLYGERLPDEDDEDCEGNVWSYMPGRSKAPTRTTPEEVRRRYEAGILVHWKPTGLERPEPPAKIQVDQNKRHEYGRQET